MNTKNLLELVRNTVENYPDKIATVWKTEEQEKAITYQEFWDFIRQFAFGLEKLGVRPGTKVAIIARNHPYWLVCDLAILSLGAVSVPINPQLSKQQIFYLLDDVDIEMVIADDAEYYHLYHSLSSFHQHLIVLFEQEDPKKHIHSFESVCKLGQESTSDWGYHFIRPDDLATIVYTLGTTGKPKGVMLTHNNLIHSIQSIAHFVPISEYDICTSLLSLSFLPERIVNYLYAIYQGATIVYTDSKASVGQQLQLCRPTFMLSIPKVFQEIYDEIHYEIENTSWKKKRLFVKALETAEERAFYTDKGYNWSVPQEIQKKFDRADQQVFSLIRERLGGNFRFLLSFGTALDKTVHRFFTLINIPILECYGLTESTSIIACNHPLQMKHGTVGQLFPGTSAKLHTNGELLIRSESVMLGYYKRPEQTTQTIIDGWLHTGDFANIDHKGYIKILPQQKRCLFLRTGQKIDPQPMEQSICTSPYIYQAFIVGNGRKFVTALIIPDFETLGMYAEENQFPFSERNDLLRSQAIQSLIQSELDNVLAEFPEQDQPQKFVLLPEELTLEKGDLTIHGQFRAAEIEDKYSELIEAMYV